MIAEDLGLITPDVEELRDYMIVRDARNLEDYLTRFDITLSVMQTEDALEYLLKFQTGMTGPAILFLPPHMDSTRSASLSLWVLSVVSS